MNGRAQFYRFLSALFQKEPDETELKRFRAVRFPDGPDTDLVRAGKRFEKAAGNPGKEDIAEDYSRVFLGAGLADPAAAFPYESVYTSPKGLIMQDAWSSMHETLSGSGMTIDSRNADIMEDHISVELEYMAYLAENAEPAEQTEFLNLHLMNWVPRFCGDVEKYARTEFYRACAGLLASFIAYDSDQLKKTAETGKSGAEPDPKMCTETADMSFRVTAAGTEEVFKRLAADYDIYGPAADGETVRFRRIDAFSDIVTDRQSDFSPKEIFFPISQTLFRFDGSSYIPEIRRRTRPALIFARACDINAVRRLDNIFLRNGGKADAYYSSLRANIRFALLECGGFENCFCVSMGSNETDDYALAVRISDGNVFAKVRDASLLPAFEGAEKCGYTPTFVGKNEREALIPRISEVGSVRKIYELDFWKDFKDKCISCGGCNAVCPTCSCYETADYLDQENSRKGERRRVWSSCMIPEFTSTTGGRVARPTADMMMRFRVLHKVFDYNERFGGTEHMCVGCGRCIRRCPEKIDFIDTVNRLHEETERLIAEDLK